MDKIFQIGSFCFALTYPAEIRLPPHFLVFEAPDGEPAYFYRLMLADTLPPAAGKEIARRRDMRVFEAGGLESRLIGSVNWPDFHACCLETAWNRADIYLDAFYARDIQIDTMFCALLALERRMVQRGGLILHCAYVKYRGEAILFSAPSGTGKTTQANLWERYRAAETVNGDKALLQCVNGRWTAQGWPVCGSSGVCQNAAAPVRAVVALSQDTANHAERLGGRAAFGRLYSQITVNSWNRAFVQRNMDLIEQLTAQVPVYHLGCTVSEEAVDVLEAALYPQDGAPKV